MGLTENYRSGDEALRSREIGVLLDGVETKLLLGHSHRVLDRYTFRQVDDR